MHAGNSRAVMMKWTARCCVQFASLSVVKKMGAGGRVAANFCRCGTGVALPWWRIDDVAQSLSLGRNTADDSYSLLISHLFI
jgi:hypothetical protein